MNEIERAIETIEGYIKAVEQRMQSSDCGVAAGYDAMLERRAGLKTALDLCRAELTQQENAPLTWNERINQMTLEEKAIWLYNMDVCRVSSISIEECNSFRHCVECMKSMLASSYTEGEAK